MGVFSFITRRHQKLFDIFELHGEALKQILEEVETNVRLRRQIEPEQLERILDIERTADFRAHAVIRYFLDVTLIDHLSAQPLEREDAIELIKSLEDMVNALKNVAIKLKQYDVFHPFCKHVTRHICLDDYFTIITGAVKTVIRGLRELRTKETRRFLIKREEELDSLEKQCDTLHRETVGKIVCSGLNPLVIWEIKEIYEILENVVDHAKHVGYSFRDIAIKEQAH